MRKDGRAKGKREVTPSEGWKGLACGVTATVLTTVFLIGLCAVLIAAELLPEAAGDGGVLLSCAAGAFVGGRIAAGRQGSRGLLCGLTAAVLTAVVFGLSGFILYDTLEMGRCAAVGGACLCGGGLAGVLGGGGKKRRV